jgi:hypothetical protein
MRGILDPAQPKVSHFDLKARRHQQVGCLEVPMDDDGPLGVEAHHASRDVHGKLQPLGQVQGEP